MQATIAVVLVVCGFFSHGRVHAASVGVSDYTIPIPNLFNGSTDTGTNCNPTSEGDSLDCFDFNMNTRRLVDGDTGPLHSLSSTNLHRFLAWNRTQTQPVTLRFGFQSAVSSLSSVVLYFFNYPTQRIGLPSVTLRGSSSSSGNPFYNISFFFNINDVLMNSDSQLRNVSLSINSNTDNIQVLFIDLVFTNTDIDWILLSEVDICEGPPNANPVFEPITFQGGQSEAVTLGPNSPQSSVRLSCTVTVSGSFQWTWQHNGDSLLSSERYQILTGDATRSSILVINKLNYTDEGTYSCVVNHVSQTDNSVRDIMLALLTVLKAEVGDVIWTIPQNGVLHCEMYGYLRGEIEWLKDGQQVQSGGRYNITFSAGSREGQDGGESSVSSVVSQLTIQQVEQRDEGTYTCTAVGTSLQERIYVNISRPVGSDPTSPPSPSPTSPPSPSPTSSVIIYIAIGAVVALLLVLTLVVLVVIIVIVVMKRKRKMAYLSDDDVNHHPPLHSLDSKNIEMTESPGNGIPQYSEITPIPKAVKVTSLPREVQLHPNPMYDSSECLIGGTIPKTKSVETFDSALLSEFNIYAIPDRPVPPPIPPYRGGTPDLGNVYTEKISPSMFQGGSSVGSSVELHPYSSIYADPEQIQRTEILEVTEKNIVEIKELGVGQFGEVVLAHTVGLSLRDMKISNTDDAAGISILIAVKKLKSDIDEETRSAFEKEIKFMAKLRHENVVRLLGVCLQKQAFIMMEYMENGDLNQYLKKHDVIERDIYPLPEGVLSVPLLIHICLQIASGMRYLASHKCIHRDLATRNCLVGQKSTVKIADFGMSRNLYSSVYYQVQGRAMLPIRWMSNECFYGRFSEKTDIWAFGVTMWEIFVLCKEFPYPDLSDQEVINNAIQEQGRTVPNQPESCPSDVYHIMLRCWENDPDKRADFEEAYNLLAQIHAYSDI